MARMVQGLSVPRLDCAKLCAAQISKIGRNSPRAQETQRFKPSSVNGAQKTEHGEPRTEIRAQRIERGKPQPFALSLSKRKRSIGRSLCSALSANHRLLTPNSSSWLAKGHRFLQFPWTHKPQGRRVARASHLPRLLVVARRGEFGLRTLE